MFVFACCCGALVLFQYGYSTCFELLVKFAESSKLGPRNQSVATLVIVKKFLLG